VHLTLGIAAHDGGVIVVELAILFGLLQILQSLVSATLVYVGGHKQTHTGHSTFPTRRFVTHDVSPFDLNTVFC
jgi:hypothetical protein